MVVGTLDGWVEVLSMEVNPDEDERSYGDRVQGRGARTAMDQFVAADINSDVYSSSSADRSGGFPSPAVDELNEDQASRWLVRLPFTLSPLPPSDNPTWMSPCVDLTGSCPFLGEQDLLVGYVRPGDGWPGKGVFLF